MLKVELIHSCYYPLAKYLPHSCCMVLSPLVLRTQQHTAEIPALCLISGYQKRQLEVKLIITVGLIEHYFET